MKILKVFWGKHFRGCELVVAVLVIATLIAWSEFYGGAKILSELVKGNRSPTYSALAQIFGSLLGFAITAASIVIGFSSAPSLTIIHDSGQYRTLWDTFASAIRWLGFATLLSLLGLLFDTDNAPHMVCVYLTGFAVLIVTFRLIRCVWILERLVALVSARRPSQSSGGN